MKKLSLFGLIFVLFIALSGCSFLQVSPDLQTTATDFIVFNVGCVGIIEAPETIEPAAVIAKSGLDLINEGTVNIGNVITELMVVLNIDFDNKILQANIVRMMDNIKIAMLPDADTEKVKVILESFLEGIEACDGGEK